MKMVWIICNESISEEVMEILDNDGVSGYTVWQNVLGKNNRNGSKHWGTDVFPGKNWALMIFCPDENVSRLEERFVEFEKNPYVRKAGLKVIVTEAEEIL
jgi:nitrogen regulatory protein PII